VRDAVRALPGSERPVGAVAGDRVVGVADRTGALQAMAGEGG
jgi:hypothetical protein